MASVTTSPLLRIYTLKEFWDLPEPSDHSKLELIAGVIYMTPPPEHSHDRIVTRLNRILTLHLAKTNDRGRIYLPRAAIWTDTNTYLEPDLFYVSHELEQAMDPEHRTSADLVIEVVSAGSAVYDRNTKAETYAALGVKELWLVDQTTETVEVRIAVDGVFTDRTTLVKGEQIRSSIFMDLALPVDLLFKD